MPVTMQMKLWEVSTVQWKLQEGQYCSVGVVGRLEVTCLDVLGTQSIVATSQNPTNIPTRPCIDLQHELTPHTAAAAPATGLTVTLPLHTSLLQALCPLLPHNPTCLHHV